MILPSYSLEFFFLFNNNISLIPATIPGEYPLALLLRRQRLLITELAAYWPDRAKSLEINFLNSAIKEFLWRNVLKCYKYFLNQEFNLKQSFILDYAPGSPIEVKQLGADYKAAPHLAKLRQADFDEYKKRI